MRRQAAALSPASVNTFFSSVDLILFSSSVHTPAHTHPQHHLHSSFSCIDVDHTNSGSIASSSVTPFCCYLHLRTPQPRRLSPRTAFGINESLSLRHHSGKSAPSHSHTQIPSLYKSCRWLSVKAIFTSDLVLSISAPLTNNKWQSLRHIRTTTNSAAARELSVRPHLDYLNATTYKPTS